MLRWTQSVLATTVIGGALGADGAVTQGRPARWIGLSCTAEITLALAELVVALVGLNLSHPAYFARKDP